MDFFNALFVLRDANLSTRKLDLSVVGAITAANVVIRNSIGTLLDTFPISGTVTANIGTLPTDPFGTNADIASTAGSISAKLRWIALWDLNTGLAGATTLRVTQSADTSWITTRVNYTSAQTDVAIVTASSTQRILVKKVSVMASHGNTVDVAARIGFGAANTPTGDGTVLSHPGIAAGSGVIENCAPDSVTSQTLGDDLRITSTVPTTGSIDVIIVYKLI